MANEKEGERLLIWAIDLGTTAFTIAYQWAQKTTNSDGTISTVPTGEMVVLNRYPDQTERGVTTVPTDLYYNPNGKLLHWGHTATDAQEDESFDPECLIRNWKIVLHRSSEPTARDLRRNLISAASRLGKSPRDFLADFLNAVYDFSFFDKDSSLWTYCQPGLEKINIEVVIALPPGWMREEHMIIGSTAARHGLSSNQIFRVSETECLIRTLAEERKQKGTEVIKVNETILVVDAGGGTVCIVLYRRDKDGMVQLFTSESLSAGSELVTEEFSKLVQQRLEGVLDRYSLPRVLCKACKHFEDWKKKMDGPAGSRTFSVPILGLTDDPERGFAGGEMKFSPKCLEKCFQPSFRLMCKAIKGVMAKLPQQQRPKYMLLGGAYGCGNKLLRSHLEKAFGDTLSQPPFDPEAGSDSVARGAILTRLQGDFIGKRASKYSYGIVTYMAYKDVKHSRPGEIYHFNIGKPDYVIMCQVITWIIRAGQLVGNNFQVDHDSDHPRQRFYGDEEEVEFTDLIVITSKDPGNVPYMVLKHEHWRENVAEERRNGYDLKMTTVTWRLDEAIMPGTARGSYPRHALPEVADVKHKGRKHRRLDYRYNFSVSDTDSRFKIQLEFQEPFGSHHMEVKQTPFERSDNESKALDEEYQLLANERVGGSQAINMGENATLQGQSKENRSGGRTTLSPKRSLSTRSESPSEEYDPSWVPPTQVEEEEPDLPRRVTTRNSQPESAGQSMPQRLPKRSREYESPVSDMTASSQSPPSRGRPNPYDDFDKNDQSAVRTSRDQSSIPRRSSGKPLRPKGSQNKLQ